MNDNKEGGPVLITISACLMVIGFALKLVSGFSFVNSDWGIYFNPDFSNYASLFIAISVYSAYRGILEYTRDGHGPSFPNAWKIIVALILMACVSTVAGSYVSAQIWGGVGSNPKTLVDAIIKLIEYFRGIQQ